MERQHCGLTFRRTCTLGSFQGARGDHRICPPWCMAHLHKIFLDKAGMERTAMEAEGMNEPSFNLIVLILAALYTKWPSVNYYKWETGPFVFLRFIYLF